VAAPYWNGLRDGVLRVQRCGCGTWQFGGEWLCHHCHAWDPAWVEVEPQGRIYSWERVWHAVHPALKDARPLPGGDRRAAAGRRPAHAGQPAGRPDAGGDSSVPMSKGVFEPHAGGDGQAPYGLLQWRLA
jgi:hypothetical protein